MRWMIDLDGTITSNPDFFKWWTYQLRKKGNRHVVDILTARNPGRFKETIKELKHWGITYNEIYSMDADAPRILQAQADWKIEVVNKVKPTIWIDNNLKLYKTILNIDLDKVCPGVTRIQI
jgi:hypothetical protein